MPEANVFIVLWHVHTVTATPAPPSWNAEVGDDGASAQAADVEVPAADVDDFVHVPAPPWMLTEALPRCEPLIWSPPPAAGTTSEMPGATRTCPLPS